MKTLDRIFATAAMLAFIAYLSILIWKVPKFGLVLVAIISVAMGIFDFARSAMIRRWRERADARRASAR
jgi:hypothetical protein